MNHRNRALAPLTACLAAIVMLTLSMPARAVEAPENAIGKNTALVVWLDVTQIDAEMIDEVGKQLAGLVDNPLLQDDEAGLPLGEVKEMVDGLTTFHSGFRQAGGQGLLLTMEMPEEESWSPPISVLAKTTNKVDVRAMGALVRTLSDGEMDAELLPIADGWHDLSIVSKTDGEAVTVGLPAPDKKAYTSFDKQLGAVKKPFATVVFRMQDSMRDMLEDAAGGGGGGQQDPQMAMMLGMIEPIKALDTIGLSVTMIDKDTVEVDAQMVFLNAQQANMFLQMYNSIMMLAPAMLMQGAQGGPDAPDPAKINAFFMKLQMKGNGDTLKLKLDKEFFDLAEEIAPMLEGLAGPGAEL